MARKSVAIMQPYFIPYLGYWHLMQAVDLFILLDDVQYSKNGWTNRNRVLFGSKVDYITVPVRKAPHGLLIRERQVADHWSEVSESYLARIRGSCSARDCFEGSYPFIEKLFRCDAKQSLFDFNYSTIRMIRDKLGIDTELAVSSNIGKFQASSATDRVLQLCESVGASDYINAIGGRALYSPSDFIARGIKLHFVESGFLPYRQSPDQPFEPGLSILDLFMSLGSGAEMDVQLQNFRLIE